MSGFSGCGGNCKQGRAACDCERTAPTSRGLPVFVVLLPAALLVALALVGCKRQSVIDAERAISVECQPVQEIDRSAKRERATGLAAAAGWRVA